MSNVDPTMIEHFMKNGASYWNAGNREGYMGLYQTAAPDGLEISYAGRAEQKDGWLILEEMWDKHNSQIEIDTVVTIINGDEAAIHYRNRIVGTEHVILSLETYHFTPGKLSVKYYLLPPNMYDSELAQFRGFAIK